MSFFDKRTACVLSTIVLFALVAGFIYGARRILIVFLFAVLFAYLLEPSVSLVQRRSRLSRGSRSLAILQVYVILLLIISGITVGIGPRVADEGRRLAAALPSLLDQVSSGRIVTQLGGKHGWSFETQMRVQQFFAAHRAAIIAWASDFGGRATMLLANTVWLTVIPILAVFFLRDARGFADSIVQMAERSRQRQFLSSIVEDLNVIIAGGLHPRAAAVARTLCHHSGHSRRRDGVHSCRGSASRCAGHFWCRILNRLSPFASACSFLGTVATGARLRKFTAHHGRQA